MTGNESTNLQDNEVKNSLSEACGADRPMRDVWERPLKELKPLDELWSYVQETKYSSTEVVCREGGVAYDCD